MSARKKTLFALATVVIASMILVSCAPTALLATPTTPAVTSAVAEATAQPTATATAQPTAKFRLVTPGKLTIGFNPLAGVCEMINGKPEGWALVFITEVARRLNLDPVYVAMDFPSLIPALQSGRIDVIAAGFSTTQPRAQILYFSVYHFMQPEAVGLMPGTSLSSWEEAAARHLTMATTTGGYQDTELRSLGVNTHSFDTVEAAMLDVVHGGSFAYAGGIWSLIYDKAYEPSSAVTKLNIAVMNGPMAVVDTSGFPVSRENPALHWAIDKAVTDMWREGYITKTYETMFPGGGGDLFLGPPRGNAFYAPGPWEPATLPPVPDVYAPVPTVSKGELAVGVMPGSALLQLKEGQLVGPEAVILGFVADKLGLKLNGVTSTDPVADLRAGKLDVIAGSLAATEEGAKQYWQSTPIGFSPDYIYVKPLTGGSLPTFGTWEDVTKAGGKIAIVQGNPREADLKTSGANVLEVADTAAGLKALVDGSASGFVTGTVDYAVATAANPSLAAAGIEYLRNNDVYSHGDAFVWGVKGGNGDLLDGLNQAITAAWQAGVVGGAYRDAFSGADVSALLAPGPAAIGTSYGSSNDMNWRFMYVPGPWRQAPGIVQ